MATASTPTTPRTPTLGDLIVEGIPPGRIVLHPTPGTATGADVEAIRRREGRLCELIDGTLVEKTMGSMESILASRLIYLMLSFVEPRRLGEVLAPDGMIWFGPNRLLQPDAAYYSFAKLPGGAMPDQAILTVIPELVVEILSKGNTKKEMDRKLRYYFDAGVDLVWYADPRKRVVSVYEAVNRVRKLDHSATLDGGAVLPGLAIRVGEWLR